MVNFVYTFVGTLFIQMWSIFIHLRVIFTIVVDLYTFEGSFVHLWEFIHLRVQQCSVYDTILCFSFSAIVYVIEDFKEHNPDDIYEVGLEGGRYKLNLHLCLKKLVYYYFMIFCLVQFFHMVL